MVRPIVLFRPAKVFEVLMLALACSMGSGCATDEAAQRERAREAEREARHSSIQQATYADDGASSQMTVQGEEGTLNEADVESAINDHFSEIRQCTHVRGKGSPRAGGRLVLRLYVDGKGEVDDVEVVESNIGNHSVERCIADICLGVTFEPPAGHKPTTFDYPVEFRTARPLTADRQRKP
jgi:TonB family protein